MLWKSDTPWLPNNNQTAGTRLQSLKRKLKRDENFDSSVESLWRTSSERIYQKAD